MVQPTPDRAIVEAVEEAFRAEPRLGPGFGPLRIAMEGDGLLVLEGRVPRLAHKKLALLRAAAVPGVDRLVDRLHVAADEPARHLRTRVAELFARDPDFAGFEIREDVDQGELATEFRPVTNLTGTPGGRIDIEENDGIVTLNGTVPSLIHKRAAGVLPWRVPGVRDVINGIAVEPPEEDGPDTIEEAVRVVLDRDPAVDASQIRVGVRGRVVRLTGFARSSAEREIAENVVWAVFGVDDVVNEIEAHR